VEAVYRFREQPDKKAYRVPVGISDLHPVTEFLQAHVAGSRYVNVQRRSSSDPGFRW
jgi:hypothetical protein